MSAGMVTKHAISRMSQRGFRRDDLDLIRLLGTEVDDGYLVLNRDCQAAECELKQLLRQVQQLGGKRIVVVGERVVTVYRAEATTERRLVRGAKMRAGTGRSVLKRISANTDD